jgi:hypothetical protein
MLEVVVRHMKIRFLVWRAQLTYALSVDDESRRATAYAY